MGIYNREQPQDSEPQFIEFQSLENRQPRQLLSSTQGTVFGSQRIQVQNAQPKPYLGATEPGLGSQTPHKARCGSTHLSSLYYYVDQIGSLIINSRRLWISHTGVLKSKQQDILSQTKQKVRTSKGYPLTSMHIPETMDRDRESEISTIGAF